VCAAFAHRVGGRNRGPVNLAGSPIQARCRLEWEGEAQRSRASGMTEKAPAIGLVGLN
jgi:hypothetical protein